MQKEGQKSSSHEDKMKDHRELHLGDRVMGGGWDGTVMEGF